MAESVLLGLNGEPNIYECAFVASDVSNLIRLVFAPLPFAPLYTTP